MQEDSPEPYPACPYCLTRIVEPEPEQDREKTETETSTKEKHSKNKEKPSGCNYHLGYLSEREQKAEIPEECIVCKSMVDCMLRKILG